MILILTASIMYWSLLQQAGESELLNLNDGNVSDANTETSMTDETGSSLAANQPCALAMEDTAAVQNEEESQAVKSANS